MARTLRRRLASELGFSTLSKAGKDVYLLLLTRYLRMVAFGSSTLILAEFLADIDYTDWEIGFFMSATLAGDVLISLLLTFVADAWGRRAILVAGGLLMTGSGLVFAFVAVHWGLLLAAVFGVISPSGNEIGPFRAIEEATLAQLSDPSTRSDIFAWYVVIGTLGTATGSFGGGWIVQFLSAPGRWRAITAYKFIFFVYSALGLSKALITLFLSRKCELQPDPTPAASVELDEAAPNEPLLQSDESSQPSTPQPPPPPPPPPPAPTKKKSPLAKFSRKSTFTLLKLCSIFFFDSLASGMIPYSLIAFYMTRKFGMPDGQLGSIISAAQLMSSIGSLLASAIAKRIGLVKAMVFTHLPSAILLALVPAPTSLVLTVMILVARASLSSMDQAPRSAFLSAVVLPQERTATMGVVNTVKTLSQSSGPLITGMLAGRGRFGVAFVAAGCLKVFYDVAMLTMFVGLKLEGDKPIKTTQASPATNEEARGEFVLDDSDDDQERESNSHLLNERAKPDKDQRS